MKSQFRRFYSGIISISLQASLLKTVIHSHLYLSPPLRTFDDGDLGLTRARLGYFPGLAVCIFVREQFTRDSAQTSSVM